jgi:hypothetical protein
VRLGRGLLLAVLLGLGSGVAPASATVPADDARVPGTRLFSFADDELFESSGLVDRGDVVYTTNDSGDDAVLYAVDPRTGETVGRTTYADDVSDVEALAPGSDGTVLAGDIGDNRERRDTVTVHRVTPGQDEATSYDLTYPDGARDAETLLARPGSDRLFVVSKSVFGGVVFAAPSQLRTDRPNRLRPFARVGGLVTDGSFLPDGRHVLLRTYGTASVYTFPAFELVGTVRLPGQRQGEGISVSRSGRVLVSSEGVHADVLRLTLSPSLTAPSARAGTSAQGPPPSTRAPSRVAHPNPGPRDAKDWAGIGLAAAGVLGLGWFAVRGSRVRRPR